MLTYDIKNHCVKKPKKDISLIETDFGFWYDETAAERQDPARRSASVGYLSLELQEQLNTLMLPFLVLIGLAFAVAVDPYVKKPVKQVMLLIDAIELSIILACCVSNGLEAAWTPKYVTVQTALSVYCYIMRPVIIVLFIYIIWDDPRRRLFWIPAGLNAAVYLMTFFRPWTFQITPEGHFIRGSMGYAAHWTGLLLLLCQLNVTLWRFRKIEGRERLIPIANAVIVLLGVFLDSRCHGNGTISFTEICAVFCFAFYYIWLHLRFVREHEQALVAEQRIQIMMSQIQPHFLYNTLTTIQALCLENPRKAASITERFAAYLRQNIDSLNETGLIPFRKELNHTLVYAQIEMERFQNIHLDYEIEDEDFLLPALTVQPLVENAIRHGVRGMPRGQIEIITGLLPDGHEIIIRDNGRGFRPEELPGTERSHIGIQNVQERLQKLCGGTMTIESEEGRGTSVTIHIPQGKEQR